jgi:hypothetical protein
MASRAELLKTVTVAAAVTLLAVGPAFAGGVSVGIRGTVRTICRVEVGAAAVPAFQAGETGLGRMTELCNNVEGYRLILIHPAGLVDAFAVVDGQRVPLSSTATQTIIVDSNQPAFRERDLGIILSSGQTAMGLSLRAEAKGMMF